MTKILDYIENNITDKLEITELAQSANYSAVQFTRNFTKATGYTPANYITKRKLFFAAYDLLNTNEKIIDIAMRYNFESHDSFSRAFKRIYDMPPEYFRRKGFHVPEFIRPFGKTELNEPYEHVEIVTLPEIKLIGVERRFRAPEQAWEAFDRMYDDVFRNAPNRVYPHSRNATYILSIIQPNGDFNIFAGIETTSFNGVPKNVDCYILPEQLHAMLWLNNEGVEYRGATDFLYMKWLSQNTSDFQSGQTESYPIATVEYFVPEELRSALNMQTEAVYVPVNPVIVYKEVFEQRRVYSLIVESSQVLTIHDRCFKEEAVRKMLSIIEIDNFDKPFEIILLAKKNICEVMFVTNEVINHNELHKKIVEGGEYLKADTSNRCPHIAQAVFKRILLQAGIDTGDMLEIYNITGNKLLTLTPMSLCVKNEHK